MLATHNPPALPERLPDSARRVKRQHPGDCEPLPEKALDPTRLARQNAITLGLTPQTPLTTTASFIETIPEFLGHADSKTTQIYAHYAPSEREVQMVNEAFTESGSSLPDVSSNAVR